MKKTLLLTAIAVLALGIVFAWGGNNVAVNSHFSTSTQIAKAKIAPQPSAQASEKPTATIAKTRDVSIQHRTVGTPIATKHTPRTIVDVPANDDCSNAVALSGTEGTQTGTCIDATVDCPDLNADGAAVWYSIYLPNADNSLTIDFCPTYNNLGGDIWTIWPVLFSQCDCDTGSVIAYDVFSWGSDDSCNYQPYYRFNSLPGPATYYIPVYVLDSSDLPMDFEFYYLVENAFVPPQGDNCNDPFVITSFPYTDAQNSCDFSNDYGYSGEDVVYEFTLTDCQDVTASLCNSPDTFDTYLWIMDDCGVSAVAADDDGCMTTGYGLSTIEGVRLQPGTYWIVVDAYTSNCGNYVLDVDIEPCPAPPPYDNCADIDYDSVLVEGASLVYDGDNTGATLDPDCDSLTTEMSWIEFSTTELLDVTISFCGTDPVRTGYYRILSDACPCPIDFFFDTGEDDTTCGDGNMTLYFNRLPAGTWYYPVIGGTSEGPYHITVSAGPATGQCDYTCSGGATPEGETCGDDTNGGCNSTPPVFGSISPGEHVCGTLWADGGQRDTDWFEYDADRDTLITFSAAASIPIDVIAIDFTEGCADTEYVYLGGNGADECDTTSMTFAVENGHNIALFVSTAYTFSGYPCADGPDGEGFPYECWLDYRNAAPPANDDCANAIAVGEVTDYAWSNYGATTDNNGSCDPDLQADVWYLYTPTCDGMATVDLGGSSFDTFF